MVSASHPWHGFILQRDSSRPFLPGSLRRHGHGKSTSGRTLDVLPGASRHGLFHDPSEGTLCQGHGQGSHGGDRFQRCIKCFVQSLSLISRWRSTVLPLHLPWLFRDGSPCMEAPSQGAASGETPFPGEMGISSAGRADLHGHIPGGVEKPVPLSPLREYPCERFLDIIARLSGGIRLRCGDMEGREPGMGLDQGGVQGKRREA